MTKGIPKKRQRDEQLRKKRLQGAPARAVSAKTPPKATRMASKPKRVSGGACA